jgi:hypothetical protein
MNDDKNCYTLPNGDCVGKGCMHDAPTVPCKWCRAPTPMTGTRECNAHWELRHRIEHEPEMALKMLRSYYGVKVFRNRQPVRPDQTDKLK